ncbi:hypothetical protein HJG60_008051 [Phyllostomus discolor]|uniref:Uncharacterized protein n=1 Tax=Phyllostomus discolor TaxID=89673 RepID=A0A834EVU8_9CHIR|nr:hypothetical protein HJG60_008051 [Phyllostomus discolor]
MAAGWVPRVLLKLKPGFPVRSLQLNTLRSASSPHRLPAQMARCVQRRQQIWTARACPSAIPEHPPYYPLRPGRTACQAANSCRGTPVIESSCRPGAVFLSTGTRSSKTLFLGCLLSPTTHTVKLDPSLSSTCSSLCVSFALKTTTKLLEAPPGSAHSLCSLHSCHARPSSKYSRRPHSLPPQGLRMSCSHFLQLPSPPPPLVNKRTCSLNRHKPSVTSSRTRPGLSKSNPSHTRFHRNMFSLQSTHTDGVVI